MSSETTILSVWPDEIEPDVQPPRIVLEDTLAGLSEKTKGILLGLVKTYSNDDEQMHVFSIIVPRLNHFEQELITVKHSSNTYYPCEVLIPFASDAFAFRKNVPAFNDRHLKLILTDAIRTSEAKVLIVNLIARANDVVHESVG